MEIPLDDLPNLFPLIVMNQSVVADGGSDTEIDVVETKGYPPMIFDMKGVSITFHLPGVTMEQVEQVVRGEIAPRDLYKLATGGFFMQIDEMEDKETF